jgi:hypothetical protein
MKTHIFKLLSTSLLCSTLLVSCTKEEGKGGDASISGRIFARKYNSTFTQFISSYFVADEYVYIIYGDDLSYGERVKTGYDGVFEFKYLYPGDYRIYVYSKDSLRQSPTGSVAVIRNAHIKGRKEKLDIGQIDIFETP